MCLHPFHLVFALVEDLLNRRHWLLYVVKEDAGIGDEYVWHGGWIIARITEFEKERLVSPSHSQDQD